MDFGREGKGTETLLEYASFYLIEKAEGLVPIYQPGNSRVSPPQSDRDNIEQKRGHGV